MNTPRLSIVLDRLEKAIKDASIFVASSGVHFNDEEFADARSELANASNAIDEAIGLIDELMAPEPTREELEG